MASFSRDEDEGRIFLAHFLHVKYQFTSGQPSFVLLNQDSMRCIGDF